MGLKGEYNLGQLLREKYPEQVFLLGFTTYSGVVTAASDWDMPAERKGINPALAESHEALFHSLKPNNFLLCNICSDPKFQSKRLQRFIGVIYKPETERISHYYYTFLPTQFNAIIHIDNTNVLVPLELNSEWKKSEIPETYPMGL